MPETYYLLTPKRRKATARERKRHGLKIGRLYFPTDDITEEDLEIARSGECTCGDPNCGVDDEVEVYLARDLDDECKSCDEDSDCGPHNLSDFNVSKLPTEKNCKHIIYPHCSCLLRRKNVKGK